MAVTLVVETGAVVSGANTFISKTDADTYHEYRGHASWALASEANRNIALINGADYLCRKYRLAWKGARYDEDQALCWPRSGVSNEDGVALDYDVIPQAVKDAQCEAALIYLTEDMQESQDRGGMIQREKVDVIEVEYMAGAMTGKKYPAIDSLLSGLLKSTGFSVPIERC